MKSISRNFFKYYIAIKTIFILLTAKMRVNFFSEQTFLSGGPKYHTNPYALVLPTVHRWSLVIWSPNQMWVNWNIKWGKCPIWVPLVIIQLRIGRPHLQCLRLPVYVPDPPEPDQDCWKNKTAVLLGNFLKITYLDNHIVCSTSIWYENSIQCMNSIGI